MSQRMLSLIVILAAVAGASQLLVWWLRPSVAPPSFAGPPRSSYTLHNFSLTLLDSNGRPSLILNAPQLDRRNSDASLFIDQPQFVLPQAQGPAWKGTAQYAWINAPGTEIRLNGRVRMQQAAAKDRPRTRIDTANVTAWLPQHLMRSAATTVIRQPGVTLRGVGFVANSATHTMELLAHVHGLYQTSRSTR
ncbi:MAG TPA: LPS export ABC transporter periplasmic protein LptC [Mizugakiibacter sp.]|nr:LPS export ABC transporter periplasmic protein LptC [Mizugakiibacter sp.]